MYPRAISNELAIREPANTLPRKLARAAKAFSSLLGSANDNLSMMLFSTWFLRSTTPTWLRLRAGLGSHLIECWLSSLVNGALSNSGSPPTHLGAPCVDIYMLSKVFAATLISLLGT